MKEYYDFTSDVYTIATVLDPRFKLDYYKNSCEGEDSATDIKAVVIHVYQVHYSPPPGATNEVQDTHSITPLLGIFRKRAVNPLNGFESYCQDPSQLEGGTMADVWKAHEHTYPNR